MIIGIGKDVVLPIFSLLHSDDRVYHHVGRQDSQGTALPLVHFAADGIPDACGYHDGS